MRVFETIKRSTSMSQSESRRRRAIGLCLDRTTEVVLCRHVFRSISRAGNRLRKSFGGRIHPSPTTIARTEAASRAAQEEYACGGLDETLSV